MSDHGTKARWSSHIAAYLGATGAAVGLGSVWRFPYLTGTGGGSAFIIIFVIACVLIATPLLAAEFALGRASGSSPPQAAGVLLAKEGRTSLAHGALSREAWNAIGILGALAAFLLVSYYTVLAGWLLAYAWKCASGVLAAAGPQGVAPLWRAFLGRPLEIGAWHAAFMTLLLVISARGLQGGIEPANRVRAPALLLLLVVLVGYALLTGDARGGLSFAFKPDFSAVNAQLVLTAIGQAFYATGVGMAMMIAFGAYIERGTSLVRTSLITTGSILLVSLLATMLIFPLVFAYDLNPAQGPELVFEVLPRVFTEMPAGRFIGTLFFLLLVLAALTPAIAALEPSCAWLIQRFGLSRSRAVWTAGIAAWLLGWGTVLSFNVLSGWHPLGFLSLFAKKSFFDVIDYTCSNILLPAGAFLTSLFMGWRLKGLFMHQELQETTPIARAACGWLLRYLCPLAILSVFVAALI